MNKLNPIHKVRSYLILFFMLLFIFRITFLTRMRDSGVYTTIDLYNSIQIFCIFCLALILLRCGISPRLFTRQSINYFILLFILGIISGFWSSSFSYSAYRAFEALILLMASIRLMIYARVDFEYIEKFFVWLIFLISLLSFLGWLSNRSTFSIISMHSNGYPISGAILFSYSLGVFTENEAYPNRKIFFRKFLIFGSFLLFIGTSLGAIIATLGAVSVILIFPNKNRLNYFILLLLIGVAGFMIFINASYFEELFFFNKNINELGSLNGRAVLWEMYLQMIYEKPILGWGFDVISREASGIYATNTHFFIISILGGLGLLGLAIFFIGFVKLIIETLRYNLLRKPGHIGFMAALTAAFMSGGSKGYIGEHIYPETVVFFLTITFFSICYKDLFLTKNVRS